MADEERTHAVMAVRTEELRASFAPLGEFDSFGQTIFDFGGQVIRSEEGWTVAIFRSATASLDAAASVQILAARPLPGVRTRPAIAIDLGDLRHTGVGWVGGAIDNAARLAECAASGQILVSRGVTVFAGSTEHRYGTINASIAEAFGVPTDSELLDWPRIEALAPLVPRREPVDDHDMTVGRAEAIESVRHAVGRASTIGDGPEIVVIGGSAGSGKSRLLDEAVRAALAQRATPILGRCRARVPRSFDAIIDAAAPLFDAASHPHLQLWTRGKPGLSSLFPGLAERRAVTGESSSGIQYTDEELTAEVAGFLLEVSRDTPLVILLDDADSIDERSLGVLDLISANTIESRLVMVLAADSDASSPSWSRFVEHNALRPESSVIELAPLGNSDLTELAGSMGYQLSVSDIAALQKRSGGLVRVALQALREEKVEQQLPGDTVLVKRRLSGVGDEARRVAEAAALCGEHFDIDVVCSATGLDEDRLALCLAELEQCLLLKPADESAGRVRTFAEPEFCRAIESTTNGVRLVSLHQKLADAFAKRSEPDDRYELAAHLDAARPLATSEAVAEAWISAATWALRAGDFETGRRAAERGVRSLVNASSREIEARLWLLIAHCAVATAAFDDATDAAAAAAEASAAVGNLTLFCEAAAIRCPRRYGEDNTTMIELADRAVARFTPDLSSNLRSRVLTARARHERVRRADELTQQALSLARSEGSTTTLVDALTERLFSLAGWPDAQSEARRLAEELLALPLTDSSLVQRFEAVDAAALVMLDAGDRSKFERLFTRLETDAGPSPCASVALTLDRRRSLRSLLDGQWASAVAHASGSELRASHDYETDTIAAQVMWASLQEGRIDRFEAEVNRIRRLGFDGDAERAADATIAFCKGRIVETRVILREFPPIDPTGPGADCFSRSTVLAFLGRIAAVCGSERDARLLLEQLEPRSGTLLAVPGVVVYGPADRWIGGLLARLGRLDEAFESLEAALDLDRRLASIPSEAKTWANFADLYRLRGDRPMAMAATSAAWEIADEIGMKALVSRLEATHSGVPFGGRWVTE